MENQIPTILNGVNISNFKEQSEFAKYAKPEKKWEVKRGNEWIEILPTKVTGPTLYYEVSYKKDEAVRCTVTVNWYDPPCPDCFWKMTMQYTDNPEISGHLHKDPLPPPLKSLSDEYITRPIESGELKSGQKFVFGFKIPKYSTRLKWNGLWLIMGARQYFTTDIIDIKVKGLVELSTGTGYSLVGKTDIHPSNHWVIPDFKKELEEIGKLWNQTCPKSDVLYYNDASLIWGGIFDINGKWTTPHDGHDVGVHIDISKKWIRKGNREQALKTICKKAIAYSEGDDSEKDEVPHYHVIYRNASKDIIDALEKDYKYIFCCSPGNLENIPQKCIDLESGGQPVPESLPIESDCK
ncbi:MAG: hypothetical protein N2Z20_04270 [Elusimicrobiales bacterium]|nr:hypothetical protein [Elusimicrobiales bacterium]